MHLLDLGTPALLGWLGLGIGVGLLHALALHRTAARLRPDSALAGLVAQSLGRIAGIALVLLLAVRAGPWPLLLTAGGVVAVRLLLVPLRLALPRLDAR